MTEREYATSLGLAKLGVRGRLSREAHAAILKAKANGMTFDTKGQNEPVAASSTDKPLKQRTVAVDPQKQVLAHDQDIVWGIDLATSPGQQDQVIAFDTCSACNKSIRYCTHAVPQLPDWLGSGNALMELV